MCGVRTRECTHSLSVRRSHTVCQCFEEMVPCVGATTAKSGHPSVALMMKLRLHSCIHSDATGRALTRCGHSPSFPSDEDGHI